MRVKKFSNKPIEWGSCNSSFMNYVRRSKEYNVRAWHTVAVALMVILSSMFGTMPADAKKKVTSKSDSLQLKIDSIQNVFLSQKSNYDKENEKAYLKQRYDTAKLFNLTRQMFATLGQLDSLDVAKNKKPKYRKKNSEMLDGYRRNLYNGGNYFLRKGNNKEAFCFYDDYIECAKKPMFESYNYNETDSLMPQLAFWALVAAGLQNNHHGVLKHSDLAYKWVRQDQVLQMQANAYMSLDSIPQYAQTLRKGFDYCPSYTYFFNGLVQHYLDREELDSALILCNEALSRDVASDKNLKKHFSYSKSGILLKQQKWDECITVSEEIIVLDSAFSMPYYNIGLCYFSKAEPLSRQEKKEKRSLLNLSRKYLEIYRDMEPKEKKRWAPLLYKVYFDLNLGKHFREMESNL